MNAEQGAGVGAEGVEDRVCNGGKAAITDHEVVAGAEDHENRDQHHDCQDIFHGARRSYLLSATSAGLPTGASAEAAALELALDRRKLMPRGDSVMATKRKP